MENDDIGPASPAELAGAYATLVDRLPSWRGELENYRDNLRSTYWFGVMGKAVALCEVVIASCGQYLLPEPDDKKRTMGQWISIIKRTPSQLPAEIEAQETFFDLLGQLLNFRNNFIHGAFEHEVQRSSGTEFALGFLDCCEQLVKSEIIIRLVEASRGAA